MSYKFDAKLHVHTLDGQPLYGTSTVIKDVMPPFLAKWGAQCAVDFIQAYVAGAEDAINGAELKEIADDAVLAWSKVRKEAADKGTDMHAALEEYVKTCLQAGDGDPKVAGGGDNKFVQDFAGWAQEKIDKFLLTESYVYSKELWTGGIVDCVAHLKDGRIAVIDFKSSKEAYFNQFAQAAGYALQLEENGAFDDTGEPINKEPYKIDVLIVVPFGAKKFTVETIENVAGYKDVFKSLVNVYGYLNSFKKAD